MPGSTLTVAVTVFVAGSILAIFPDLSLGTHIEPAPETTFNSPAGLAMPVVMIACTVDVFGSIL